MANKVIMPKQGLQMTEGIITKWITREGQSVKEGEPLFEMETDKLSITMDSNYTGILLKILKDEGETVPITETIAIIGETGEDYSELLADNDGTDLTIVTKEQGIDAGIGENFKISENHVSSSNKETQKRLFATPRAKTRMEERDIRIEEIEGTGPDGLIIERDVLAYNIPKASPTARNIAQQSDVSLGVVEGSGVNGKIMKSDVLEYLKTQKGAFSSANLTAGEVSEQAQTVIEIAGMRKAIFNNMLASLQTMAQANHKMKVDMSETVRFRQSLKDSGIKVSYTDIIIKVVSQALLKFPMLNSSVVENTIVQKHFVNMGFAVALENGLIVPNIKNSHLLSLGSISRSTAFLAAKAREGKLSSEEYTNGTFTITNLGMYDIDEFTAIINPPESAILAIGKIADAPVCVNQSVEIRPILTLSLTYDHRIIDGAPAAEFLQYIKKLLQNPYLLILTEV